MQDRPSLIEEAHLIISNGDTRRVTDKLYDEALATQQNEELP